VKDLWHLFFGYISIFKSAAHDIREPVLSNAALSLQPKQAINRLSYRAYSFSAGEVAAAMQNRHGTLQPRVRR
jgi:hypothetical protein